MKLLDLKKLVDDPSLVWLAQAPEEARRRAKALGAAAYELEYLAGICLQEERRKRLEGAKEELLCLRELLLAALDTEARSG